MKTQIAFSMFPLGTNLWEQPLWYVNCLEHAKLDIIDTVKRNVNQGLFNRWREHFTYLITFLEITT